MIDHRRRAANAKKQGRAPGTRRRPQLGGAAVRSMPASVIPTRWVSAGAAAGGVGQGATARYREHPVIGEE